MLLGEKLANAPQLLIAGGVHAAMKLPAFFCCVNGREVQDCKPQDIGAMGDGSESCFQPQQTGLPKVIRPRPMLREDLNTLIEQLAAAVKRWPTEEFVFVRKLEDASGNQGCVDLMRSIEDGGRLVAVKRMPNTWVAGSHEDFNRRNPEALVRPWVDMGFLKHLNTVGFSFACEFRGVFRDPEQTFVVTSLCTQGDLHAWCNAESVAPPGKDREKQMLPLVMQLLTAVRWLHELGIAHLNLCLENVMLTDEGGCDLNVKVIDFSMSMQPQGCICGVRGQAQYQAPEMHEGVGYEPFLADAFAAGVLLFAMATQDFPWTSTRPQGCPLYGYINTFGFRCFLQKRKLRYGSGEFVIDILSLALLTMLEGLLHTQVLVRTSLGERCYSAQALAKKRLSVWDATWLEAAQSVPSKMPAFRDTEDASDALEMGSGHERDLRHRRASVGSPWT